MFGINIEIAHEEVLYLPNGFDTGFGTGDVMSDTSRDPIQSFRACPGIERMLGDWTDAISSKRARKVRGSTCRTHPVKKE
jgi:hypothetical protein